MMTIIRNFRVHVPEQEPIDVEFDPSDGMVELEQDGGLIVFSLQSRADVARAIMNVGPMPDPDPREETNG